MPQSKKTISILGSTGSVGQQTAAILRQYPDRFDVDCLVANNNVELLIEQASQLRPKLVVAANPQHLNRLRESLAPLNIDVAAGDSAVIDAASRRVDICVAAIVGFAGLRPTFAAIQHAKRLAFVGKECLVCSGNMFLDRAKKYGCEIIPTDSEHSAIFQLLLGQTKKIDSVTLTASGGPFWDYTSNQMRNIKPIQAIAHPVWRMGKKISVDCATLFNKGLEIIEAHYLFGIDPDKIKVLIHPKGIVHSLVSFQDGSVLAHMGLPDMRMPISYALFYPDRAEHPASRLDLETMPALEFHAPDHVRFPSLNMAKNAMKQGGMAPLALNAANEVAVDRFLSQEIDFINIFSLVADMLDLAAGWSGWSQDPSSLDQMTAFDTQVRAHAATWQPRGISTATA